MSIPRSSGRRLLLVALAAVLAAGWLFAATRLWRTTVPGDLVIPELDPGRYFPAALLDEAEAHTGFLRVMDLLAWMALLAALAVYAVKGARFARESSAGRIGTGMMLGMLGLAFVWLAQLPFALAQLWWQRRYDTSDIGYLEWVVEDWLLLGGQFLFISLALLVVMALAGVWRRGWWLPAAPALAAIAVAFAFVQPYLFTGLEEPSREVAADARELAAMQGIPKPDVRVQETPEATEAPNAFAAGLGPSERVVLWDTLVDRFDRAEVRVVLAHELAHLSRHHVWKTLAWMALLALPIAFLTGFATTRRGGLYEPASVPVAIFTVAALLFLAAPLNSAFSQRLEAEADWIALQTTRDPDATESLFAGFTESELIDPASPAWSRILLETHPSIMRRIEMAEAWRTRNPSGRPGASLGESADGKDAVADEAVHRDHPPLPPHAATSSPRASQAGAGDRLP